MYNGPSTQALICISFGPYHSQTLYHFSFVYLFVLWLNKLESWILVLPWLLTDVGFTITVVDGVCARSRHRTAAAVNGNISHCLCAALIPQSLLLMKLCFVYNNYQIFIILVIVSYLQEAKALEFTDITNATESDIFVHEIYHWRTFPNGFFFSCLGGKPYFIENIIIRLWLWT